MNGKTRRRNLPVALGAALAAVVLPMLACAIWPGLPLQLAMAISLALLAAGAVTLMAMKLERTSDDEACEARAKARAHERGPGELHMGDTNQLAMKLAHQRAVLALGLAEAAGRLMAVVKSELSGDWREDNEEFVNSLQDMGTQWAELCRAYGLAPLQLLGDTGDARTQVTSAAGHEVEDEPSS